MKLDKVSATRHHSENLLANYSRDGEDNTSVIPSLGIDVDQRLVFLPSTFRLLHV